MKVLITGVNGFLGQTLASQLLQKGFNVIGTGKGDCRFPETNSLFTYVEMDFTDPFAVHDVFNKFQPEIVVHAGAMTQVDECEQQQWQAYLVNTEGTVTMLLNAEEQKSFFVFISTDFVFAGDKGFYDEEGKANPINFYGKTKAEAEDAVREYEYGWAIVRTSLVYGKPLAGRKNILTVVKEKLESGETYKVVDDQVRTPTYVDDLAAGIVSIIEKKATGTWHLSGKDILTPYAMACSVADFLQADKSLLEKVTAETFSQPAKRPPRTNLLIDKAIRELNFQPVGFIETLQEILKS